MKKIILIALLGLVVYGLVASSANRNNPLSRLLHPAQAAARAVQQQITPIHPEGNLADYRSAGHPTIILFEASWCSVCRDINTRLAQALENRPDVAVKTVCLDKPDDWPVYSRACGISIASVPHVVIFAADGRLLAQDKGENKAGLRFLNRWLDLETGN